MRRFLLASSLMLLARSSVAGGPELRFDSGQVAVVRDGKELARAMMTGDAPVRGHPGVGNSAFAVVAECLVVLREAHDLGPTCHDPPSTNLEIYTLRGEERKVSRFRWPKSFYQGSSFSAPSGDWGIALSGRRALLDGFLFVRADGTSAMQRFDVPLDWSKSFGAQKFNESNEVVFPGMMQGDREVTLVIDRTGDYDIIPKVAPAPAAVEGGGTVTVPRSPAPNPLP